MDRKEINEAIEAAERTLELLAEAESKMKSAKNLGIWDMLGGGFFVSMFKHSNIDDAQSIMYEVEEQLKVLSKELKDVNLPEISLNEVASSGDRLFDMAFDNIFTDMKVQGQISDRLDDIYELENKIEEILEILKAM